MQCFEQPQEEAHKEVTIIDLRHEEARSWERAVSIQRDPPVAHPAIADLQECMMCIAPQTILATEPIHEHMNTRFQCTCCSVRCHSSAAVNKGFWLKVSERLSAEDHHPWTTCMSGAACPSMPGPAFSTGLLSLSQLMIRQPEPIEWRPLSRPVLTSSLHLHGQQFTLHLALKKD